MTKDNSLNKAHVKSLESELWRIANEAKQCNLENIQCPGLATLTEAEQADVEAFLEDVQSIMPLVGLDVFEEPHPKNRDTILFHIDAKGIKASGYEDMKGFVVKEGSGMVSEETNSIPQPIATLRADLIARNVVAKSGENYRFTKDHAFNSPSAAAAVVQGRSANGRLDWLTPQGKSLREVQEGESDPSR